MRTKVRRASLMPSMGRDLVGEEIEREQQRRDAQHPRRAQHLQVVRQGGEAQRLGDPQHEHGSVDIEAARPAGASSATVIAAPAGSVTCARRAFSAVASVPSSSQSSSPPTGTPCASRGDRHAAAGQTRSAR